MDTPTQKGKTMTTSQNPTAADYEKLARTLCLARGDDPDAMTGEIPQWEFESIDEDNVCVTQTLETLDDFRRNSPAWREPGTREEIDGGLYWEKCQAMQGQTRCELCIVDCEEFRLAFQY